MIDYARIDLSMIVADYTHRLRLDRTCSILVEMDKNRFATGSQLAPGDHLKMMSWWRWSQRMGIHSNDRHDCNPVIPLAAPQLAQAMRQFVA